MARLKGDLTSIDLMVPFSTRPGGRVFDLSKDLHFEIQWDGVNIIERFTGDILNGAGHTSISGPGFHTGFEGLVLQKHALYVKQYQNPTRKMFQKSNELPHLH